MKEIHALQNMANASRHGLVILYLEKAQVRQLLAERAALLEALKAMLPEAEMLSQKAKMTPQFKSAFDSHIIAARAASEKATQ